MSVEQKFYSVLKVTTTSYGYKMETTVKILVEFWYHNTWDKNQKLRFRVIVDDDFGSASNLETSHGNCTLQLLSK